MRGRRYATYVVVRAGHERRRPVLQLLADGAKVADVASQLYLSQSTIKTHLEHIYRKLGATDRTAAVARAMREGLIT